MSDQPIISNTVDITTKACPVCGYADRLTVSAEGYKRWIFGNTHIQDAFPELLPSVREQLLTGLHGRCFKQLFEKEGE